MCGVHGITWETWFSSSISASQDQTETTKLGSKHLYLWAIVLNQLITFFITYIPPSLQIYFSSQMAYKSNLIILGISICVWFLNVSILYLKIKSRDFMKESSRKYGTYLVLGMSHFGS